MIVSSLIWIIWAGVTAIWFAVAEYMALSNKYEGDTLSENLRALIGNHKVAKYGTLGVWITFATWFALHIWFSIL
jgi:hypothetical protein